MDDLDIDALLEMSIRRTIGAARGFNLPSLGGKRKPLQLPAGTKIAGEEAGGQWAPKGMGKILAPSTPATRQGGPRGRKAAEIEQQKAVRRAITKGIGSANAGNGRGGAPSPNADDNQTRRAISKVADDLQRQKDEKPSDGSKKVVKGKTGGQASGIRGFNAMRSVMNGKLAGENSEAAQIIDGALATVLNPNKGDMNPDAVRGALKAANQNIMQRIAKMDGKSGAEKAKLQAEAKAILAQVRQAMETDIKGRVRAQKAAKKGTGATGRPTKKSGGKTRAARSGQTGASVGQPRSAVGDARRDPDIPDTGGQRKPPVAKLINRGSQSVGKAERDAKKGIKPEPGISYTPRGKKKTKKVKESLVNDILQPYFKSNNL